MTAGELLDTWLRRFASTAHSERAGPAQLAVQLADDLGPDPSLWDVDAAPFRVTGVHNRIDLMGRVDGVAHCGELRVSVASTDEILRPFHALFLFRQPAAAGDVDDDGTVACRATALAWALLSDASDAEFLVDARALLDASLVPQDFLMIETVELTVSPWEWRQWLPVDGALQNPPLFQQIDPIRVNAAGAVRADFLAFVEENASALASRTLLIPERFRAPSVRVAQGIPWVPLNLDGVDEAVLGAHPTLRQNLEIVGCAACHTADAEFVQTREDRSFSPFYTKELEARGVLLQDLLRFVPRTISFGPLQSEPVLPP